MRSLTAHLRDDELHDRLPFHPSCPICRQNRLSGTLDVGGPMSMRTQALLAAGLLAASTTAPVTVAFAAEPEQQEGAAPIAQSEPPDSATSPDFDPGGEATDLPDTDSAVPETPAPPDEGNDDIAPVEQPPATDPDDQVVDPGDGSDTATAQPPAATEDTSPPTAPATPPSAPVDSTVGTPPPAQDTTPVSDPTPTTPTDAPAGAETPPSPSGGHRSVDPAPRNRGTERSAPTRSTPPASLETQVAPAENAGTPTYTVSAAPSTAGVASATAPAGGRRARPGDRTHTVFAGESLWAIATDLLGRDATPAAVAREVHRLWQLNRDRIATGDPNLLMIGTRLLLR